MNRISLLLVIAILLLFVPLKIHGDGWTHMTDIPGTFTYPNLRYAAGCAIKYNDTTWIYIFGGNYNGYLSGNVSNRIYKYDPWADLNSASCWTEVGIMPYAAYDFAAWPGVRNNTTRIYLFGGSNPPFAQFYNYIYEYTPQTGSWLLRNTLQQAREGIMQAASAGGKIYAIGGHNSGTFYNYNEEYDPATNTRTTKAAEPAAKCDQAVVSVGDTAIYCIGGARYDDTWGANYTKENYQYRPSVGPNGTWYTRDSRADSTSGSVGAYFDDIIYTFSGGNLDGYFTRVWRYRVSTNSWLTNGPTMSQIQDGAICGVVRNFYKPTPFSLISPLNGSTVGSLRPTLLWHESDRTKGPRIWVISGGTDGSTPTGRNSAYTISSDTSSANDTLLYTLLYSTDPGYTPCDSINNLTNTTYTFTFDLTPATRYYWKVRRNDYYEGTERWSTELDWWFETPAVNVELSTFNGWVQHGVIKLGWRTESEDDNVRWLIERAFQRADHFIAIAAADGHGTKPGPTDYLFTDTGVFERGRYYYRIGDVNSFGHITWHGPIAVDFKTTQTNNFSALPKPGGRVEIAYTIDKPVHARIELYDIAGRCIATFFSGKRARGTYTYLWNGKSRNGMKVRSGVYFCRMQTTTDAKTVKFLYMR